MIRLVTPKSVANASNWINNSVNKSEQQSKREKKGSKGRQSTKNTHTHKLAENKR